VEPVLIVLTQSRSTARWATRSIRLGLPGWPSLTVRPLVLSPESVPLIADEEEAKRDVLKPLADALATTDTDRAGMLAQFVESCLVDTQARQIWKELMMPVHSIWAQRAVHATHAEDLFSDHTA
jgi:hypothetical protein